MSGFVNESDLLPTEKNILEDQARVNDWVEGLDATHLYESLLERLQERDGINLEESEIAGILLEVCARLQMLEEIEREIEDINKVLNKIQGSRRG